MFRSELSRSKSSLSSINNFTSLRKHRRSCFRSMISWDFVSSCICRNSTKSSSCAFFLSIFSHSQAKLYLYCREG
ncbi:hypothetical protein ZOSMA_77G00010 [Zostera marina]|uniref:Uncharacterized protein n=1 Tax=Zostera marina TaxID=29655 RepID=A0A0K9NNI3_ZOSMR|nr:hypothetical protein ZOSMA_77G00010 [Zostera marina]